eukprot:836524_1
MVNGILMICGVVGVILDIVNVLCDLEKSSIYFVVSMVLLLSKGIVAGVGPKEENKESDDFVMMKKVMRILLFVITLVILNDRNGCAEGVRRNGAVNKSTVVVERVMSQYGVICVEDMIDALAQEEDDKEDKFVVMHDGTKLLKTDRFDAIANALN